MEFSKEQTAVMQEALNTYGIDKQLDIAIEEMSELTKAIIKHRRYASRETYENLCEETADVAIMIEQIFLSTKCDDVAKYVVSKIDRLKDRLKGKATDNLKVTTVPSTFVKTFVYDYAEDFDDMVNHYAEDYELEIKSISICYTDVFVASVVFERSVER